MYLTQIHNYVFNIDTPMLEMNSVSILGILIDNLSKKKQKPIQAVHIVPLESVVQCSIFHYSHYPKVEKYLFS